MSSLHLFCFIPLEVLAIDLLKMWADFTQKPFDISKASIPLHDENKSEIDFFLPKTSRSRIFLSALKRKGRRQASKRERKRKTLTDIYFEIHLKLTLSLSLNKQYTRESVQWKSHFPNAITFVCAIQTETSNGCWKRNIWPQGCRY